MSSWLTSLILKFPKGSIWEARYICLPTTLLFATVGFLKTDLSAFESTFYFALGALLWTFMEYILHRWVLHYKAKNQVGNAILKRLHIIHHHEPNDKTQVCIPFLLSAPIWSLFFFALLLFGGGIEGSYFVTCGLAMMMIIYDITHYSTHYMPATNWYLKLLKKHHMNHHFSDHSKRFGVTSPIWDYVFRTID